MTVGVIHSTINSGFKSRKFNVWNETCHRFFSCLKISRIFFAACSWQLSPFWMASQTRNNSSKFCKIYHSFYEFWNFCQMASSQWHLFYLTFRYVIYQWLFKNSEDVMVQIDLLPMHKVMLNKLDSFRGQKD